MQLLETQLTGAIWVHKYSCEVMADFDDQFLPEYYGDMQILRSQK